MTDWRLCICVRILCHSARRRPDGLLFGHGAGGDPRKRLRREGGRFQSGLRHGGPPRQAAHLQRGAPYVSVILIDLVDVLLSTQ